ncbi:phosphoadenylyl-sulfate reductase [Rhodobacteraceae bacterium D3-12]|nr:phosphoadenylyl-sulfate reductase [Rhodobacteraceae bacterium D3-12]
MLHLAQNTPPGGSAVLHPRTADVMNAHFSDKTAEELLDYALSGALGRIAMVSSFGAEAAALLHMVARVAPATPVLFLDTQLLFPETLAYQRELASHLGLSDVRILTADTSTADPDNTLHKRDTDACCALRKTAPLDAALTGFDGWITGRKRFQSGTRTALDLFEIDTTTAKLKLNPLVNWSPAQINSYFDTNALPRHPLVARGYPSLGCTPCTTPVKDGEDPRAGRWRGTDKQECGIHFVNGRMERIAS